MEARGADEKMDELNTNTAPISDRTRERLRDVRRGLLGLHKTLLESERDTFERARGRIESSGEFLQLVMNDPWFAWLRHLSELIVQMDEMLDADEQATEEAANQSIDQARVMLRPSETGGLFEKNYFNALQRDPDVVLAHAGVVKLLAADV